MRPVISRENAETLIKNVSSVPPSDYSVSSPRELSAKYDTIIKSLDFNQWLELFVSIRTKKEIAISNKKKVSAIDERYGKKSEELLYGELAAALGVTKSDIAMRFEEEFNK
jgi:CarD family transcriptional regulator